MSRRPRYLTRHRQRAYNPVFLTADQRADCQRTINQLYSLWADKLTLAPNSPFVGGYTCPTGPVTHGR